MIADRPLTDIVPLQLADAGAGNGNGDGERVYKLVTQFSMKPVEELGLLKMDFLGLRNLDVIEDALDIIERSTGERPDMTTLPLDDAKTYEMLAARRLGRRVPVRVRGHAGGAEEGQARRSSTTSSRSSRCTARARWTRSRPTRAASATRTSVSIPDERLEPIIGQTYGVILYQEQAMQIAKSLAGFSGAKADDLRKAIGKKNRDAMAAARARVPRGLPRVGHERAGRRVAVGDEREVGRLLVQQAATPRATR